MNFDISDETSTDEDRKQPEDLIEQCHISPTTFIGFLFENYIDFYSSIDDTARLDDYFSFTECILHEWEVRIERERKKSQSTMINRLDTNTTVVHCIEYNLSSSTIM